MRARKSELLRGHVGHHLPVIAKRVLRPNRVWEWYLAREIAIYRGFGRSPPPILVPRLIAADEARGLLILERLGAPVATHRNPAAEPPRAIVDALVATQDRLAGFDMKLPALPPSPYVRSQLRARLLEDPTAPGWVMAGLERCARLQIVDAAIAGNALAALAAYPDVAIRHGDLLLRNAIGGGGGTSVGLVDWECAGLHPRDWDLALLWSQLGPASRCIVEAATGTDEVRWRAFLALCVFAIAREIRFLLAFRTAPTHPKLVALRDELIAIGDRILLAM